MLGHKASLGKFKEIEIISSFFSDHSAMRWEINYKEKTSKKHKHMAAKQYATKQPLVHWRNQKKKKKNLQTNENASTTAQNLLDAAKVVTIQSYFKKQEKISNRQLNLTPKTTR